MTLSMKKYFYSQVHISQCPSVLRYSYISLFFLSTTMESTAFDIQIFLYISKVPNTVINMSLGTYLKWRYICIHLII